MEKADLHMHSYFSDGHHSPEELVIMAKEAGLSCIALTDHDTVEGNKALIEAGDKHGLEVIPGVEISSDRGDIVGLFIDPDNPVLRKVCEEENARLTEQAKAVTAKMAAAGFDVTWGEVDAWNKYAPTVLQHLAELMISKGYGDDYWSFYRENVAKGGKFFVPMDDVPVEEAIKAVRSAGGFAIFAHPWHNDHEFLFNNIDRLISVGLGGIEDETSEIRPDNYDSVVEKIRAVCRENDLVMTKGTDFHNKRIGGRIGKIFCDYSVVEEIKRRLGRS